MANTTDLDKDNRKLRALLHDFLSLDPANPDRAALETFQENARAALSETDRRATRAGFTNPEVRAAARQTQNAARTAFLQQHGETLRALKASGLSYARIADELNAREIPAPKGGRWAKGSVEFQIKSMEAASP